jgi:hypothetical protein
MTGTKPNNPRMKRETIVRPKGTRVSVREGEQGDVLITIDSPREKPDNNRG